MKKIFVIAAMSLFFLAAVAPMVNAAPTTNTDAVAQVDDKEKKADKEADKNCEKKCEKKAAECEKKKESCDKKE